MDSTYCNRTELFIPLIWYLVTGSSRVSDTLEGNTALWRLAACPDLLPTLFPCREVRACYWWAGGHFFPWLPHMFFLKDSIWLTPSLSYSYEYWLSSVYFFSFFWIKKSILGRCSLCKTVLLWGLYQLYLQERAIWIALLFPQTTATSVQMFSSGFHALSGATGACLGLLSSLGTCSKCPTVCPCGLHWGAAAHTQGFFSAPLQHREAKCTQSTLIYNLSCLILCNPEWVPNICWKC